MPSIHDIVPFDGPATAGARAPSRSPLRLSEGLTRREMLRNTAIAAGVMLSVKVTGVFDARPAGANPSGSFGYRDQWGCAGYSDDYYANPSHGGCSNPCGPSEASGDYCVDAGYYAGWHRNAGIYSLRPGQCNKDIDAWKWGVASCYGQSYNFRCHDGWKDPADAARKPTICVAV